MNLFQCILRYQPPLFDAIDDWIQCSSRRQAAAYQTVRNSLT